MKKKKPARKVKPSKKKSAHVHVHEHEHDGNEHGGGHGHGHGHAYGERRGPELREKEGKGKIVYFDAPSGLAGDMTIAALVDLGVPERVVIEAVEALPLRGFHVHFGTTERSGVVATTFDVHVEGRQPERTYKTIRAILDKASIAPSVKKRAHATFELLAKAEAKVHRTALDDVHFHEVGAVDAIVDIVGSAAALEYLGASLVVSPLPMGHGWVKARHGTLPLPAPAVVECLAGFPTYDGKIAFELVTPTGAAIVAAQANAASRWPSFVPERTGWGAGRATLVDRPNVLRVVLGEESAPEEDPHRLPTHVVLEANVDDATGELVAYCIESWIAAGALDAWATPLTMKKGRPAFMLSALAPLALADRIASAMLTESTSLGLRRYEVARVERPRRIENVQTPFGVLPVKVAEGPYGSTQRKPEFDACLAVARAQGVPVRDVLEAAMIASLPKAKRPLGTARK